ncbi:MAG: hypothetical protein QOH20_3118 [Mycobacterium sp.]|nr:hypothetical protein [Mycobacterium sp.]
MSTDAFVASRQRFDGVLAFLDGSAAELAASELEDRLAVDSRELMQQLMQDHLDLRATRERRVEGVVDANGVARGAVETGHARGLHTVFGEVDVTRMAYRSRGRGNLYPTDAALNLPAEKHSHGLRRLAMVEAARGSFDDAVAAIERATGQKLGKRQVEALAARAAVDFDAFYTRQRDDPSDAQTPDADKHVLVISCDGKGVVMRPQALREATARKATSTKLKTRLSKGEKANRKRMAEVGAVYDIKPAPRTAADILPEPDDKQRPRPKPPATVNKWLTASVVDDAATVVSQIFDEAHRRDPQHTRTWIALVDGNNHQIDRIKTEAKRRDLTVTILIDLIHVIEYVWKAAWCLHTEGDPAAETWVHHHLLSILNGKASRVAATIRAAATRAQLDPAKRAGIDTCANYLLRKAPYLDYPTALANGWPIATGVIEGACRHLVKDRMDITGARWGLHGAETVLKLRAIAANDDLDNYWTYHLNQERQRIHASRYDAGVMPTAA